jgi:phage terminase large subunit GpA-like protein
MEQRGVKKLSKADKEFLLGIIAAAPVKRPVEDIAAWVEGRRILPASTPIPGPWHNAVTPYGVEIMQSLAPNSGIQKVAVMKSRKCGLTTIMENVIGYYILENPSEILYATASDDLARDWGENKIMPVIESMGGLDRITANVTNAKSRRTGDRSDKKEYIGGKLDIMSSQSKRARRQLDKRCLFIDEVDGVEAVTSTGEGKWIPILEGHTASWGSKRKIAIFGSPTVWETSLTREYYEQGDCRHFFVPCPYCGEPVELRLDIDSNSACGLKAETAAGEITGAYYLCERCGEPIRNEQKLEMFSEHPRALKHPGKAVEKYHWRPTQKPADAAWRSYYINALYSPIGMLTFTDIAKARAKAEAGDHNDMRSYINIYAGLPYKDAGSRPRLSKVLEHRGAYTRGTVPPGVLFLTMACDVQRGSARGSGSPPRVECEIMGTGLGYKTWSIDYWVETGPVDDPYSGAWEALYQRTRDVKGVFYSKDGIPFQIQMIGIDSGDAAEGRSEIVYRFCERWSPWAFPIKGFGRLSARSGEKADIPGTNSFKKYRMARIGSGGEHVLEVSTAHYKAALFSRLNINAAEDNRRPNGYCDFPADYSDDYFIQLTNSERREGGSFHDLGAHEAMDCRIYNLALSDAWLAAQVSIARSEAKAAGANPVRVEMAINARVVLERLQKQLLACGAAME